MSETELTWHFHVGSRKFDFFNPNSGVSEGKDGRIVSGNADTLSVHQSLPRNLDPPTPS